LLSQIALGLFTGPGWLPEQLGSLHKAGSTKMTQDSTPAAGVDIGKHSLDLAFPGEPTTQLPNTPEGHTALLEACQARGVTRVGLEASGGYERALVRALRGAGLDVIVFQPRQVHGFRTWHGRRAKTDRVDAALLAACAGQHEPGRPGPDPRLAALAEPLRLVEQIGADIAQAKTRREAYESQAIRAAITTEIARLTAWRAAELKAVAAALRAHPDLARRLELVLSVPGIGERTALTLVVRMPELGALSREQAAALAGLAPYDNSSGKREGARRIAGGRAGVRTALYAAALAAAFRWNPALVDLYGRLTARGRPHKQALVACARKLLVFANTVLARGTPWVKA
jgi:transposase